MKSNIVARLLIVTLLCCCYKSVTADSYMITWNMPFNATSPIVGPVTIDVSALQTIVYAFEYNVTAATPPTMIDFSDIYLEISQANQAFTPLTVQNNGGYTVQGRYTGYSDPCLFPAINQTVTFQYNATTNSPDGWLTLKLEAAPVATIENGQQFTFGCLMIGVCTRFYIFDIEAPADEYLLNLTATSDSGDGNIVFAGGLSACPTSWSSNRGVHITDTLSLNKPAYISTQVKNTTRFWVQYSSPSGGNLKFTWTTSKIPEEQPPVATPTNHPNGLEPWAIALIVVGSILAILIIIFVVVRIRNNRRGAYAAV